MPGEELHAHPNFDEMWRQYRAQSDRVDGIPRWQALRARGPRQDFNPYGQGYLVLQSMDDPETHEEDEQRRLHMLAQWASEGRREQDSWEVDWDVKVLRRHHARKRRARFDVTQTKEFEKVQPWLLAERKTTMLFAGSGASRIDLDEWIVKSCRQRSEGKWWRGCTEFYLMNREYTPEEVELIESYAAEKKNAQDSVDLKKESPADLKEWKEADKQEWDKVTSSAAVRVLSLEESQEVRNQLAKEGKSDRVMPTKVARRYKPADLPGEPPTKKSRLCIRGDLDPDILELERYSPTLTTMTFNLLLQIASNYGFAGEVADFKSAFCQSRPLQRDAGALYFQPPRDGVEGVHPDQLVLIINGCYGLVDAPLHWRKTLVAELTQLGYRASKMDPCIFLLHAPGTGELQGAIAVEVDDLFMVGCEVHRERIAQLRSKFTFGKWVKLQETPEGCAFNGRRIRQLPSGEFLIDMQKFIEERLNGVILQKGRASMKKEPATEEEISQARASCGALNWLAKEGRPDAAGPSSMLSSRLTQLTVEDLLGINEVVKHMKEQASLAVRIQPLSGMKLGVVTDASWGNMGYHSQGGHLIIAHEPELGGRGKARTNVVSWRSGKLQRVVNSTLAAETQSLSRGLGDLLWSMVVVEEYTDGNFELRHWPERLSAKKVLAMASSRSDEVLRGALAIVDAKGLFDQLSKETTGGSDRRTAIEIQIMWEDLQSFGGQIRWVDHPAMLADGLTKLKGSNEALYRVLATGEFAIQAESDHLRAREEARAAGQTQSQIRRSGVNKNGGDVNSHLISRYS